MTKSSNRKLIKRINKRFDAKFDLDILNKEGNEMQKGQISVFINIIDDEDKIKSEQEDKK